MALTVPWIDPAQNQNTPASTTSSMGLRKSATAGNQAQDPAVVDAVIRRLKKQNKTTPPTQGMDTPFKPVK